MSLRAVLPMRERAEVILRNLRRRLEVVLPAAMRESGVDMWIILCQEDDLDPIYSMLIPMDAWCPILQMLVFHDDGERVGGLSISGTDTKDLYARPYRGQKPEEQWPILTGLVAERKPKRIAVNIGSVQWAAGGLTHNLYHQLVTHLPPGYAERLVSAEPLVTHFASTLTDRDIETFTHVVEVAKAIIAQCYSRESITPGTTTTTDLEWLYWQTCADHGLEVAFRPYFSIRRSPMDVAIHDVSDRIIRQGDFLHCDVGIRYLRLNSDHQQWAYVLQDGETDAPNGARELLCQANRLQDVFMSEFRVGMTGNELLARILARARAEGIPEPRVYSHSLGCFLHEPGPLIGLPWEQERCEGRGDVRLRYGNAFTMELSVTGPLPEWDGAPLCMSVEEDVVFAPDGCHVIGERQQRFHIV